MKNQNKRLSNYIWKLKNHNELRWSITNKSLNKKPEVFNIFPHFRKMYIRTQRIFRFCLLILLHNYL